MRIRILTITTIPLVLSISSLALAALPPIYGSYNDGEYSNGGSNSITNSGNAGSIFGSYNIGSNSTGGSNSIINSGTADEIAGSYNIGDNSNGGSNSIANSGTADEIFGSYNIGSNSNGSSNKIANSGTTYEIVGSANGDNSNGGSNSIANSGTAFRILGSANAGEYSNGGSNSIANSGTAYEIIGSDNFGDNSTGGSNSITNSGTAYEIVGSYNFGDNSNGGSNSITNSGQALVIFGSFNTGSNSYGGSNSVANSGTVLVIYGSFNFGDNSTGGSNGIANSGSAYVIVGSVNIGNNSNGGSNSITNSGQAFVIYGSANDGEYSNGGSNSITNSGIINGDIVGSWNIGAGSFSAGNTIINSGSVSGDIWGSENDGAGSSGGDDKIINSGTVTGSIYGEDGNDTIILYGGSTLGGVADGGTGTDTLGFNNMGPVASSDIGTTYLNFENLSIYGGTTSLTGTWDFSGGNTTVYNGDLFLPGSLRTNTFIVNNGGYANISGVLNGSMVTVGGSMDLIGTLNSDSFTVATGGFASIPGTLNSQTATVYGGMNLNGILTSDQLTIASGGVLSGSGKVNGILVNYGTISPGNSIGTLSVNGSASFMPGSLYLVELRPDGLSDRIDVNGPASLRGTVRTALPRSLYANGDNWRIISASGGIRGSFDALSDLTDSETLNLQLAHDNMQVLLEVVRTPFAGFGLTPAAIAVGSGLDEVVPLAAGNMAGFITALDFDMSRPQIENVLNSLSPEMYTSFSTAGLKAADVIDQATAHHQSEFRQRNRLGVPPDGNETTQGEWTVWSRALGNWSERDSDDGYLGYRQELGGIVLGTDRQFFEALRAGLDLGFSESDLDWDGTRHSGSMQGRHIGLYGTTNPGNLFLDASIGYANFAADADRFIAFDGLSTEAWSSFDADAWAGRLEGGYNFTLGKWLLSPVASLNYAHIEQEDFTEYGADFLSLDIDDADKDSLISTLGFRFSGLIVAEKWQYMPRLDLRWLHQFEDEGTTVTANFINYQSASFDVTGIAPVADQGVLSLGLTGQFNKNLSIYVDYDVAIADDYTSQTISGGLGWRF